MIQFNMMNYLTSICLISCVDNFTLIFYFLFFSILHTMCIRNLIFYNFFKQLGIEDKPWNKRDVPSIEKPPSTSATKLPLRGTS